MKILATIILTAIVTAIVTFYVTTALHNEQFAQLLWARCPQLILKPHDPEVSYIQTLTGYIPVRPREPRR